MSTFIPQYAKSTDPEVLAVIARNIEGRERFREAAAAFAKEHGAESFYVGTWGGSWHLSAIPGAEKPKTGQWKQARRRGTWEPFKNNPVRKEFDSLRFNAERIPGLAEMYAGPHNPDGSQMLMTPRVFVYDGVAYMSLPAIPDKDQHGFGSGEFDTEIWAEILPSEWHAAHEAHTGAEVTR